MTVFLSTLNQMTFLVILIVIGYILVKSNAVADSGAGLLSKLEPILSNPATAFIILCVCVCVCGGGEVLTGTFIHARGQQHCYKHTQRPVFPQHSQTYVPLK